MLGSFMPVVWLFLYKNCSLEAIVSTFRKIVVPSRKQLYSLASVATPTYFFYSHFANIDVVWSLSSTFCIVQLLTTTVRHTAQITLYCFKTSKNSFKEVSLYFFTLFCKEYKTFVRGDPAFDLKPFWMQNLLLNVFWFVQSAWSTISAYWKRAQPIYFKSLKFLAKQ